MVTIFDFTSFSLMLLKAAPFIQIVCFLHAFIFTVEEQLFLQLGACMVLNRVMFYTKKNNQCTIVESLYM